MISKLYLIAFLFAAIAISGNLTAQTLKDTLLNPQEKTQSSDLQNRSGSIFDSSKDYMKEHHVYVLDGKVITAEEYRAMSLSTLKYIRSITSKDDPTFKKYANDKTKVVELLTKAKNFEESMLNVKIDIATAQPVVLVDGVEVQSSELSAKINPREDVIKLEVIARNDTVCKTFAPRTGGIVKVVTKSKKILNEIIDAEKERMKREDPQASLDTSKMMVYLIDGVELRNVTDYKLDLDDVVSIDVSKDKKVCNLFAPRTGGVVMITTRSKKLLNRLTEDIRKFSMEQMEKDHKNGTIRIR